MIDYQKAHAAFVGYLKGFDCQNPKIKLKIVHTEGVVRCAEEIAKRMQLSDEDIQLAKLIALLHDIGRFEQVKRFDSFEPTNMDHAGYGVEILQEEKEGIMMLRAFVESNEWDSIILTSIEKHSAYVLSGVEDERTLLHARLIRDADKLDNCRVKLEDQIEILLGMSKEEAGTLAITDKVWETCQRRESVLSADRKTKMDYWLSYVACYFDVNYRGTYEILEEEDYINRIIDRIPYTNPDTKEKMEKMRNITNEYIKERRLS